MKMPEKTRYMISNGQRNADCTQCMNASGSFTKVSFCILCVAAIFFIHNTVLAQPENRSIRQGNKAYSEADFATAIKDYQKALSADDKNAIARFNMANALQHKNDAAKAMQSYDEAIKDATSNELKSKAYYNKGLSQLQQKDLVSAMESFKQSLRLTPGDNDARENLEKARQEEKRKQQPNKQDDKKPPQPPKNQKQQAMNRQMMEQKFKELQEQEKQLQNQIQKEKTNQPDPEKDW